MFVAIKAEHLYGFYEIYCSDKYIVFMWLHDEYMSNILGFTNSLHVPPYTLLKLRYCGCNYFQNIK